MKLGHGKIIGDIYEVWFSARRGTVQRECFFGAGRKQAPPGVPGTFAVRTLKRWQKALRDAGTPRQNRVKLARALAFWRQVVQWEIRTQQSLWPPPQPPLLVRLGLAGINRHFTWLRPAWRPYKGRRYLAMRWLLPAGALSDAIYLSALFGAWARTLRICRECRTPFVVDRWLLRQQRCKTCARKARMADHRAVGLPQKLLRGYWNPLRWRLNQRVARGRLSSEERHNILRRALADLQRVAAGQMTREDWQRLWDQKLPKGRPHRQGGGTR